jgi:ADP-ribose pyrophosphatase YjhB (NUDIX family)
METSKPALTQLLLADYEYRSQALWRGEQSGEMRVQLFVGFAAAVGGGLGVLIKDSGLRGEPLRVVVLGSLLSLMVLGIVTLMRMISRNEHTDKCKRGLDVIRQVFKDHFDDEAVLAHYYPIEASNIEKEQREQGTRRWWMPYAKIAQPRKFGGLAHTMAAVNSLVVGAVAGVSVYRGADFGRPTTFPDAANPAAIGGFAFAVAAVAFLAQLVYVAHRESKARTKLHIGDPTHAGGVVFRKANGAIEYLLVRAKNNPVNFVLPKGHIEEGEGHAEAALREVREETGAVARLIAFVVDDIRYKISDEMVNAKFYLMEFVYNQKTTEQRNPDWFLLEQAIACLKHHPESEYVLLRAEEKRAALFAHSSHSAGPPESAERPAA